MVYWGIGIAFAVFMVASYLIHRSLKSRLSRMSEEEASGTVPEPPETILEARKVEYPVAPEISSLPEDAKTRLIRAVWYQCENPKCRHTEFLEVHHIISEVEGGSNGLDNLLVLCPKCHAAAHNRQISEKELKSWLRERRQRFKSDLDWPYK